jgi:hypothetical protein
MDFSRSYRAEACTLTKVLAEQAIGILVRSTSPGAGRITEVHERRLGRGDKNFLGVPSSFSVNELGFELPCVSRHSCFWTPRPAQPLEVDVAIRGDEWESLHCWRAGPRRP